MFERRTKGHILLILIVALATVFTAFMGEVSRVCSNVGLAYLFGIINGFMVSIFVLLIVMVIDDLKSMG